jgi:hypothetical protein
MNSRRFTSDDLIGEQACGNIETERLAVLRLITSSNFA